MAEKHCLVCNMRESTEFYNILRSDGINTCAQLKVRLEGVLAVKFNQMRLHSTLLCNGCEHQLANIEKSVQDFRQVYHETLQRYCPQGEPPETGSDVKGPFEGSHVTTTAKPSKTSVVGAEASPPYSYCRASVTSLPDRVDKITPLSARSPGLRFLAQHPLGHKQHPIVGEADDGSETDEYGDESNYTEVAPCGENSDQSVSAEGFDSALRSSVDVIRKVQLGSDQNIQTESLKTTLETDINCNNVNDTDVEMTSRRCMDSKPKGDSILDLSTKKAPVVVWIPVKNGRSPDDWSKLERDERDEAETVLDLSQPPQDPTDNKPIDYTTHGPGPWSRHGPGNVQKKSIKTNERTARDSCPYIRNEEGLSSVPESKTLNPPRSKVNGPPPLIHFKWIKTEDGSPAVHQVVNHHETYGTPSWVDSLSTYSQGKPQSKSENMARPGEASQANPPQRLSRDAHLHTVKPITIEPVYTKSFSDQRAEWTSSSDFPYHQEMRTHKHRQYELPVLNTHVTAMATVNPGYHCPSIGLTVSNFSHGETETPILETNRETLKKVKQMQDFRTNKDSAADRCSHQKNTATNMQNVSLKLGSAPMQTEIHGTVRIPLDSGGKLPSHIPLNINLTHHQDSCLAYPISKQFLVNPNTVASVGMATADTSIAMSVAANHSDGKQGNLHKSQGPPLKPDVGCATNSVIHHCGTGQSERSRTTPNRATSFQGQANTAQGHSSLSILKPETALVKPLEDQNQKPDVQKPHIKSKSEHQGKTADTEDTDDSIDEGEDEQGAKDLMVLPPKREFGGRRQLLRPWLEDRLDSRSIPGFEWINDERTIFRIPWKHRSKNDWTPDNCTIFMEWALHTGKYHEGIDKPDYCRWKTRLRCAFNQASDIRERKDLRRMKCGDPYKVYELLPKTDARMKLGKMPNSDGKHPTGDTPKIETGDSTTLGSPEMPTPESPGENTPKQQPNTKSECQPANWSANVFMSSAKPVNPKECADACLDTMQSGSDARNHLDQGQSDTVACRVQEDRINLKVTQKPSPTASTVGHLLNMYNNPDSKVPGVVGRSGQWVENRDPSRVTPRTLPGGSWSLLLAPDQSAIPTAIGAQLAKGPQCKIHEDLRNHRDEELETIVGARVALLNIVKTSPVSNVETGSPVLEAVNGQRQVSVYPTDVTQNSTRGTFARTLAVDTPDRLLLRPPLPSSNNSDNQPPKLDTSKQTAQGQKMTPGVLTSAPPRVYLRRIPALLAIPASCASSLVDPASSRPSFTVAVPADHELLPRGLPTEVTRDLPLDLNPCMNAAKSITQPQPNELSPQSQQGERGLPGPGSSSEYECLRGMLLAHKDVPSGQRPYICKVCGQRFAFSDTLENHMEGHIQYSRATGVPLTAQREFAQKERVVREKMWNDYRERILTRGHADLPHNRMPKVTLEDANSPVSSKSSTKKNISGLEETRAEAPQELGSTMGAEACSRVATNLTEQSSSEETQSSTAGDDMIRDDMDETRDSIETDRHSQQRKRKFNTRTQEVLSGTGSGKNPLASHFEGPPEQLGLEVPRTQLPAGGSAKNSLSYLVSKKLARSLPSTSLKSVGRKSLKTQASPRKPLILYISRQSQQRRSCRMLQRGKVPLDKKYPIAQRTEIRRSPQKTIYKCKTCGVTFNLRSKLQRHLLAHERNKHKLPNSDSIHKKPVLAVPVARRDVSLKSGLPQNGQMTQERPI